MLNRLAQSKSHSLTSLQRPARYRPLALGFETLDERRCLTVDNAVPSIDLSPLLDVELVQTIHILDLTDSSNHQDLNNETSQNIDNGSSDHSTDEELLHLQPTTDPGQQEFPPMSIIDNNGPSTEGNAVPGGAGQMDMGAENTLDARYWQALANVFGSYSNFGKLAGENYLRNGQTPSANYSNSSSFLSSGLLSNNASVAGDGQQSHSIVLQTERPSLVAPAPALSLPSIKLVTSNKSVQLNDISSTILQPRVSILSRSDVPSSLVQMADKNSVSYPIHFRTPTHAPNLFGRMFMDLSQSRNEASSEVVSIRSPRQQVARAQVLTIDQRDRRQSSQEPLYLFKQVVLPTSNKQRMLRPTEDTNQPTHLNLPKAKTDNSTDSASLRPVGVRLRYVSHPVTISSQSDAISPDVVESNATTVQSGELEKLSNSEQPSEPSDYARPALMIAMSCFAPWLFGVVSKHRKTKNNLNR